MRHRWGLVFLTGNERWDEWCQAGRVAMCIWWYKCCRCPSSTWRVTRRSAYADVSSDDSLSLGTRSRVPTLNR